MSGKYLLSAITVVLLGGKALPTRAQVAPRQEQCGIAEFPAPVLCARAGLDTVRARHILIVDASGSMTPLWPALRLALAAFAAAIPDGDELDVRVFSDAARALVPTAPATPSTRISWSRTFASLPPPSGTATDLGAAAESAVQAMRGADPEQVQLVYFLTDGQHEPPASSRYQADIGLAAWRALAISAEALSSSRPISVAVVRLNVRADAEVLRRIFPMAVTTDALDERGLRAWIANTARQSAVAKLHALVQRELASPARSLESPAAIETHSDRVESHSVRATWTRKILLTTLRDSSPISLAAGGRIVPTMSIFDSMPSIFLAGARRAPWIPPGSIARELSERVVIKTQLEPAQELGRIGIASAGIEDTLVLRLSLREGGTLPRWLYYSCLVLAVAATVAVVRHVRMRLHQAYLTGRVIVSSRSSRSPGATHILRDRNLKRFTVTGTDGRELLELRAENLRGKTTIQAVPLTENLRIGDRPFRVPTLLFSKTVIASPTEEITFLST